MKTTSEMKAANVYVQSLRDAGETTARNLDPIDVAIRNLQLPHAVATATERAATSDLIELHIAADVVVAIIPLIERGLNALDKVEAWPSSGQSHEPISRPSALMSRCCGRREA